MLKNFTHFRQFKKKINFFKIVTIVKKTKIMFFNNTKFARNISNDTRDLITKIDENEYLIVAFFVKFEFEL